MLLLAAAAAGVRAQGSDGRVVQSLRLPDGATVVVAEGDLEPRSTGSYAVRLYAAGDPEFAFDRFVSGQIRPRDGTVARVLVEDLDRDGRAEVIVIVQAAGSGGYLSADAFWVGARRLTWGARVRGLLPGADPVAALRDRVRQRRP
jgi:hypothetical protein